MLKFEVIIEEEEVLLSDAGNTIFLDDSFEALDAQALSGKDRDGNRIVGVKGQTLDLHDSGGLWTDVTKAPAAGGLIFNKSYAEFVLTKYKADALNETSLSSIEERLTPKMDEQLFNRIK